MPQCWSHRPPASWSDRAGDWGWRGSAALSPRGCPGLPVHPSGPWCETVLLGRVSPSLFLVSGALTWHCLFLASPLPERDVEIVCGPLGCSWGSEMPGGPWGPLSSSEAPRRAAEGAHGWQGCSTTASVPTTWTEQIQAAKRGGGTASGVLARDISCPCLRQQVEPEVPVRSRPPAPPEPPPALL